MKKISLVIISKNEEKYIGECILSAKDIVDEIIVVDDYSTDRTKEIIIELGATYIPEKFRGFGLQKKYAVSLASNDWILSLDADERLSSDLKNSIINWKNNPSTKQAFYFNRLNYYCEKPIRHCGWYPNALIRLWNRNHANWNENIIHESVEIKEKKLTEKLKGDLIHYTMDSISDHISRTNKYTSLQAEKHIHKSRLFLYFKLFFSPLFSFISIYFIKLGFLDGFYGYMIARISSMGQFWVYSKALEKKKSK